MDQEEEYYEKLQEILERLPDISFGPRNTNNIKIHTRIIESITDIVNTKILSKSMRVKIDNIKREIFYYINQQRDYALLLHLLYLYEDILNIADKAAPREVPFNSPKTTRRIGWRNVNEGRPLEEVRFIRGGRNKTKKASKKRRHI